MKTKPALSFLCCAAVAVLLSGCKDATEAKAEKSDNAAASAGDNNDRPRIAMVPFSPGGTKPEIDTSDIGRRIMNDPEQIAAGKQLFSAMNCNGCHFNGGGGMGPPLMDSIWIYGGSIENINASIREGRPNGMPSFRGFLPDEQIWQLAAYVRSLSHPIEGSASADQQQK